jgi:hypothetical protein
MMRAATRVDMIETEIQVARFEILKQKSNTAMKNITILSTGKRFHDHEPRRNCTHSSYVHSPAGPARAASVSGSVGGPWAQCMHGFVEPVGGFRTTRVL